MRGASGASLRTTVLAVVLALLGVGVMSYPATASWFSDLQQRDRLAGFAEESGRMDESVRAQRLAAAHEYNAGLGGGALQDPFTTVGTAPLDDAALDYLGQIVDEPGDIMSELRIPGIAALLPVYHGTSDATLQAGIGHLYGSSLPVGGASTHAVLTGHRGYPEATMFTDLDRLGVGDDFTITTLGETLTYRVVGTEVVLPDDTASLAVVPGKDLVTLITCTPTGVNTHRLLVHAERAPDVADPASVADGAVPLGFPWWMLGDVAALAAGAGVIAWRHGRRRG
jgi:sortase A